jgi:hypothetical protein
MVKLPFALLAAALLPFSANAQDAQPSLESLVVTAAERVCLPILRGQVDIARPEQMRALAQGLWLTFGISDEQYDLFSPPADATINRAALFSGQAGEQHFLMAVGGVERSCRIFVQQAGQPIPNDLAQRLIATGNWTESAVPADASPRRGFLFGAAGSPEAAAIMLLGDQLPGIGYFVVILPL